MDKPLVPDTILADRTDPYNRYSPTITCLHRQVQSYHMIHSEATFGTVGSNTCSDNHAENMPANKVKDTAHQHGSSSATALCSATIEQNFGATSHAIFHVSVLLVVRIPTLPNVSSPI